LSKPLQVPRNTALLRQCQIAVQRTRFRILSSCDAAMTEPQQSLGSLGPFFGFQTKGGEENSEMEILKSFLSPEAEISTSQSHHHPTHQTPPLFTQTLHTDIQAYVPEAFPANRFEVVAEAGSLFPVGLTQTHGQACQVSSPFKCQAFPCRPAHTQLPFYHYQVRQHTLDCHLHCPNNEAISRGWV